MERAGTTTTAPWRRLASLAILLCLPAPSAGQDEGEPPAETGPVLGRPSAFGASQPSELVEVEAGASLYEAPTRSAAILARTDVDTELEVVERQDGWTKLRYGSLLLWLPPDRGKAGDLPVEPPASDPATYDEPRWSSAADDLRQERIQRARELLGPRLTEAELGPYRLLTDVSDQRLLERLAPTAASLADSYYERFGVRATPAADDTVVLFASEKDYRTYAAPEAEIVDREVGGHASRGLVTLFQGGRTSDEIRVTLVHELTHLLNRSVLGAEPPAWLEEGMANDLGFCRVDRRGRLLLASLEGEALTSIDRGRNPRRPTWSIHILGPLASLNLAMQHAHRRTLVPLDELVDLAYLEFIEASGRELRYAESAFFVRYLLADSSGGRRKAFDGYLDAVRKRQPAGGELITAALGTDWKRLQRAFESWILMLAGAV